MPFVRNTGAFDLLLPVYLTLDPDQGFAGVPLNAALDSDGRWVINLTPNQTGDIDLKPGATITGQTITVQNPNGQAVNFDPDVVGLPAANTAPVFDSAPPTQVTAGGTYTYQPQAHDPNGTSLTYLLYSGPRGMTVNPGTGLLTWITNGQSPAAAPVVLYLYDAAGSFAVQEFVIQVAGGQQPPVIGPMAAVVEGREGQPLILTVPANDAAGKPLLYWADHLPGGAAFDQLSHSLFWTPAYGQAGTYDNVTFYVSDGQSLVSSTVSLQTAHADQPPNLAAVPDQIVRAGDDLRFDLRVSASGNQPVTFTSSDLPLGAFLDPNTGSFDWSPGYNQAGVYPVSFKATRGTAFTAQTATFTVLAAPAAPVFNSLPPWRVFEGQPITFTAATVDPHNPGFILPTRLPDGSLSPYLGTRPTATYTIAGLPAGAKFDPDTATFAWTPDFNSTGQYNVTFTATDNGGGGSRSSSVTVPITVLFQNRRPVVTPIDDLSLPQSQVLDQPIRVTDPTGESLTLSVANALRGFPLPRFLTFTDNGDGTGVLHVAPGTNDRGTYTVTVSGTDTGGLGGAAAVLTGTYTFAVTVQAPNEPPVFDYVGSKVAVVGQPFQMTVRATDLDQDPLTFGVSGLPAAATLTPGSVYGTATLSWTPTEADVRAYAALFQVADNGNGNSALVASDTRQIRLVVRDTNNAPMLTALPTQTVAEGQALAVTIPATDPDGDPLTYTATNLPNGANLDPATGILTWTPREGQAGVYALQVSAGDGNLTATETVNVTVAHVNHAPQFVPLLPQFARENTPFQFPIVAGDINGDPLVYRVVSGLPAGAAFDINTGVFTWTPAFGQAGDYAVTFGVHDPADATDTLTVQVHVDHVTRPPLVNTPDHTATLGKPLQFFVSATDRDAHTTLTYTADHLPAGASLDPHTGAFLWTPGPAQAGEYVVNLHVSDGEAVTTQNILLRAAVSPQNPHVTIELTPSFPAIPGQSVLIHAIASSLAPIASLTVTLNGVPLTLDANGRATVIAGLPGKSVIETTATDLDGLVGTAIAELKVRDPAIVTPPTVAFDVTVPNEVLTAPAALLGIVASTNLDSWELDISGPNRPSFTVVATGQGTINDAALALLDPATLTNGFYQLRLTATDLTGRTAQAQTQIEVDATAKPSQYLITENDLTVNLGGTTVVLTRVYDSVTRSGSGELGFGWRLANCDLSLQTNLPAAADEALGIFNPFADGTRPYLTLPNGSRVGFTFAPTPTTIPGLTYFHPTWQADPGVAYTLQSVDTMLTKAGGRYYDLQTGQPYNPGNPFFNGAAYTLTAPDGTAYLLDAQGRVVEEDLPGGGKLFVSDSGITSSTGQTISFVHDAQGRLTCVVTPDGQTLTYDYDAAGNLVAVLNATTGAAKRYGYDPTDTHFLVAAVRSTGDSHVIQLGTPPVTIPIQGDLGGPAQFSGQSVSGLLGAGQTDRFAFRFDDAELASTATGRVILRVAVQGTDAAFMPAIPTIAGQQPLSTQVQGNGIVALFSIERSGLYVLAISPTIAGAFTLDVRVAGDVNGDGLVDGNDSEIIDSADQLLLTSNYGFHSTQTKSHTLPPTRPTFALDINSPPTAGLVTLVGTTDSGLVVTLQPLGLTATADCNGLFVSFNVPLVIGANVLTATTTDQYGHTSQFTATLNRVLPNTDLTPPTITAALAHDTGRDSLDRITSDDTVSGTVAFKNSLVTFRAQVDQSPFADVLSSLSGGHFTLSPTALAAINGGPLADGKHTVAFLATDSNGNQAQPVTLAFILDTTVPLVPTVTLVGSAFTNNTTPTFRTAAETNSIVRLFVDGQPGGHATAFNGAVAITTPALSDGPHKITANAEDVAGNVSSLSVALTVTIDTVVPTSPTLGLTSDSHTAQQTDDQTSQEIVNVAGRTDAGLTVALYRAFDINTPIRTTIADIHGNYTFTAVALANGPQSFVVRASDQAGNQSQFARTITTTANDTSPPVITAALANDTGSNPADGITSDPTVAGVVDDPSAVKMFVAALDGKPFVDVTAALHGVGFTFGASDLAALLGGPLGDGPHTLRLQATDSLGHTSAVFSLSFTLLRALPLPPTALHLAPADDTGASNTDGVTKSHTFTIPANAPTGGVVRLYLAGAQVGQATSTGTLSFAVGPLPDGTYTFTATTEDVAGNVSPFSAPFIVTIDNVAPPIQGFNLDAASDARPYNHGQTNLAIVGFVGMTNPGVSVTLVEANLTTTADAKGNFAFYPVSLPDFTTYTFTVRATDLAGNTSTIAKTINRVDSVPTDLLPPSVTLNVSTAVAQVGDTVTLTVFAIDDTTVATALLLIDGNAVALNAAGQATFTASAPGIHTATAKAWDPSGNEGDATLEITFLVPATANQAPPGASFGNGAATPDVTEPTDIIGTVNTPNLLRYTLAYSLQGRNQYVTFATGTSDVVNGVLGQIDPTLMDNGYYDVRLTAEDTSGNITNAYTVYQVDGQVKVGDFTVTYRDLAVPTPGIPLTITRTYDSRTKNVQGDFGFGWTYSLNDVTISASSVLGDAFIQTAQQVPPPPPPPGLPGLPGFPGLPTPPGQPGVIYSFANTLNKFITITLPNSKPAEFVMGFTGEAFNFPAPPLDSTNIFFIPVAGTGTTGTLEALTDNNVIVTPAQVGAVQFIDRTTGQVYNPTRWKLTAQDGTVYILNAKGIENITDPFGHTVTFSANGITSSTGPGVAIGRDAQNRITTVTDPLGHQIKYGYDFYGDLVSVTDPAGNVSRYTYDSNHTLLETYDPSGQRGARNEYDAAGRLTTTVNGDGHRVLFANDLGARQEVTTDARGGVSVTTYDAQGNVLSRTDPLGNTTSFTYDANGNQLSITDPLGNTTTSGYDANNRRTFETDPLGETTRFTYDALGDLLAVTDPMGRVTTNTYDAHGELLTTTDALGDTTTFAYDGRGDRVSLTDPLGNTTTAAFDAGGHLTQQTDALGNVTLFTYDADGNPLTTTTTRANLHGAPMTVQSRTEYDADNRVVLQVDPLGDTMRYAYDAAGREVQTTSSVGGTVKKQYDTLGRLTETILADGTTISQAYDAAGNEIAVTDIQGKVTRFGYDADNRQTLTIQPDGTTSRKKYDADGHVTATIDANGNTTLFAFDAGSIFSADNALRRPAPQLGRVTAVTEAGGPTLDFSYDADGNRVTQADPSGAVVHIQYDALNRPTGTLSPGGTTTGQAYDADGRTTALTDPSGATTRQGYDALGRLTAVIDPAGKATNYAYDAVGNKLTQTDADGNVTTWDYDVGGRVIKHTLPLGMSESYTYDDAGLIQSHTDFDGNTTTNAYDANGRRTLTTFQDGSTESATYNAGGLVASATNAVGTTTKTYDANGRLTEVVNPEGTIDYQYDSNGNRTAIVTSAGTTTYTYNTLNQVTTVTDPNGGVTSDTSDSRGNLVVTTDPNGDVTKYTYDSLGRLTRMVNLNPTGAVLSGYTYTYSAAGYRLSDVEDSGRSVVYSYDADHRLTAEAITDPVLGNETITYTYDAAGNRLTKTDASGTITYTYDANGRLLSDGTTTYTYDANGNTLTQTQGGVTTTYTYDFKNELVGVRGPNGTATFAYDTSGVRVRQTVDGVVTNYVVDKNAPYAEVLAETDGSGHVTASYVIGPVLDSKGVISQTRSGVTSYFLYDGEQSTRQLTNAAGAVTDSYVYDAFGTLLTHQGTTPNSYLFNGQAFDPLTAAYYLRARYYDPATGRFLTPDSFPGKPGQPASLNLYAYAAQNPLSFDDPSGHVVSPIDEFLASNVVSFAGLFGISAVNNPSSSFAASYQNLFNQMLGNATNSITSAATSAVNAVYQTGTNADVALQNLDVTLAVGFGLVGLSALVAGGTELDLVEGFNGSGGTPVRPTAAAYSATGSGDGINIGLNPFSMGILGALFPFAYSVSATINIGQAFGIYNPIDFTGDSVSTSFGYGPVSFTFGTSSNSLNQPTWNYTVGFSPTAVLFPFLSNTGFSIITQKRLTTEIPWTSLTVGVNAMLAASGSSSSQGSSNILNYVTSTLTNYLTQLLSFLKVDGTPNVVAAAAPPAPTDVQLAALVGDAQTYWQAALGFSTPLAVTVQLQTLPAGVLGESMVTAWDAQGRPLAGTIYLSPDAAGQGWFIDPTPRANSEFAQTLSPTSFAAVPGSDASGRYDLLTTLEHEVGHLLAFYAGNANFESHIQTVDGSQLFVGNGVRATVTGGDELDPNLYPNDVMAATLDPGVRKLPAALEAQIVRDVWDAAPTAPPASPIGPVQPAFLSTDQLIVTDDTLTNDGFKTRGTAVVVNDVAHLTDDPRFNSGAWRTFVIPAGTDVLQFTLTRTVLANRGPLAPADAFEVALLDAATMQPLAGTAVGLSRTDALLNIQQTGQVFFSPNVAIAGLSASGQTLSLAAPLTVRIDLSGVKAGTRATLYLDLLGFGASASDVMVSFANSPVSDTGGGGAPGGGSGGTGTGSGGGAPSGGNGGGSTGGGVGSVGGGSSGGGSTGGGSSGGGSSGRGSSGGSTGGGSTGGSNGGGGSSGTGTGSGTAPGNSAGDETTSIAPVAVVGVRAPSDVLAVSILSTQTQNTIGGAPSLGVVVNALTVTALANISRTDTTGDSRREFQVGGDDHTTDDFWPWIQEVRPTPVAATGADGADADNFWPWLDDAAVVPTDRADTVFVSLGDNAPMPDHERVATLTTALAADARTVDLLFAPDQVQIAETAHDQSATALGWAGLTVALYGLQTAGEKQRRRKRALQSQPSVRV